MASSGSVLRKALRNWGATAAVACGLVIAVAAVPAAQARPAPASAASVALKDLPPQAQATFRLIQVGGPFPYSKDGSVFGNRERLLPARARGYYREYTVKTPRAHDRGARRIICGGEPATVPETCFYTDDHYASFRRIQP